MKKVIFIAALMFGTLINSTAGEDVYSIGERISITSKVLNEERSILVYIPESYNFTDQRYPVMYLLDGGGHFHHVSGIVQFLAANGIIPEMIVVAILNVDRNRDFSPTHTENLATSGGADKFLKFIDNELIPLVDKNYRSQPYKLLVGHSLGGEFVAYTLLNKPDIFSGYIAISPYMMYDGNYIIKEAETKIKTKYQKPVQFYMTVGNEPDYLETLAAFENIIASRSPKGFEFTYVKMKEENHVSSPHLSIYNGLESIYSNWNIPKETLSQGLAAVDEYYRMLSEKFGYEIPTPENAINDLGNFYINNKEIENAIKAFRENANRFPESSNVYDSLGEAYETDGQLTKAEKNYKKAVEIAQNKNLKNLKIYLTNLERVQKKMAH